MALFDHPHNPRHPAHWLATNEGSVYIAANLTAHEPYAFPKGKALRLRYGILTFDERPTKAFLDEQYERWLRLEQEDRAKRAE